MNDLSSQVRALRLAGLSFADIAVQLGLPDADAAAAAYPSLQDRQGGSEADRLRLEIARIDRLHTALWPKGTKGDLGAVDRLLRISERRTALWDRLDNITQNASSGNITPLRAVTVGVGRWEDGTG